MDSEMVANSGCDDVSGMTTMSSSNWDHLFMSLNHCGSFLGSEFASNPVLDLPPNIPSQPMPLSKRKKKNCQDTQPKNSTLDEKQKSEQNQDTKDEENYIHVRAKRGHATNSHSLAERVRRERISERMRLLQELVPGCNKITGKAMMLDEIINYVQSLQQQVEFLSMKLATVNPEMNMDIDRILSKEIIQFPGSDTTMPMIVASGLSPSHSFPRYPFNATPVAIPPILPLPQHMWNNELHASFIPGPSGCSPASNEMHKTEL